MYNIYNVAGWWSRSVIFRGCATNLLWEGPEALLAGRESVALWKEGVWNSLCLFTGTPWDGVSSSDLVGVLNLILRASNLALLAVCSSQSDSSELLLVILLAFSDLALAHLGGTLLLLGGSGVEVLLICALHWSLFTARAFCWVSSLSLLSCVVLWVNGIMHGSVNYCHFREGWVQHPYCKVARL